MELQLVQEVANPLVLMNESIGSNIDSPIPSQGYTSIHIDDISCTKDSVPFTLEKSSSHGVIYLDVRHSTRYTLRCLYLFGQLKVILIMQ